MLEDARALQEAGVYSIVIEGVPSEVARAITEACDVPTIGIGAGPSTDGQVLVSYDLLGMYQGHSPKFAKRFASLGEDTVRAVKRYVEEIQEGTFPSKEHEFQMSAGEEFSLGYGGKK